MKEYFLFTKAQELKTQPQIQFSVIPRTLIECECYSSAGMDSSYSPTLSDWDFDQFVKEQKLDVIDKNGCYFFF